MDDLTHDVITSWLNHRRTRWPNTANPHLMIGYHTALGLGQVSAPTTPANCSKPRSRTGDPTVGFAA